MTPEELEAVEPGRSRTIDITDFVELSEIDPIYFQKAYYLGPKGEGARRPYDLLRQAMAATNQVAIATFVMRDKQYLVAIRAEDRVLVMSTLFFADEVRDPAREIDDLPRAHKFAPRDLSTAKQLISSLSPRGTRRSSATPTATGSRHDQAQAPGRGDRPQRRGRAQGGEVVDLLEALRASVDAAKGKRTTKNATTKKATKKTTAKKTAAGKRTKKAS